MTWRDQRGSYAALSYSYMVLSLRRAEHTVYLGATDHNVPQHQTGLRIGTEPTDRLAAEVSLRYVDDIGRFQTPRIPSYWSLAARLAWRPSPPVELAWVGQDLLRASHPEFRSELNSEAPDQSIERRFYFAVTVEF